MTKKNLLLFSHSVFSLMEAEAEPANTVDAQPVKYPPSSRFTWTIDNFSGLSIKKLYSDVFYIGGCKWRILIFPKGNNVDHLSMYLDVADSGALPYGWSRDAQFSLSVVDQIHGKNSVIKDTQHHFNARESDWGFTSFMPLSELCDPARGYLVNDTCIIEADVAVGLNKGQDKQEKKTMEEADPQDDTVKKGNHVEAQQEQPKPLDPQTGIPSADETELPTTSVNLPVAEDAQEVAKSVIILSPPLVDQVRAQPAWDLSLEETEKCSSSVAEFDALLSDIQNLLEGNTSVDTPTLTSFKPPQLTDGDIAQAKRIFTECINMKIANIIQSGRAIELKNSLSIMLTASAFPNNMVHEMTKFLANFDQSRELFMAAQQDLQEAQGKENSVNELKSTLKQFSLKFIPIRNRVTEVDQEVAKLEMQLAERKAEKAQLRSSLEDLAARATMSRQALINAEQDMTLFMDKKERAEEMIDNMESLWESLKKEGNF